MGVIIDHPCIPEQCHYDPVPVYLAHPRPLAPPNLEMIAIVGAALSDNAIKVRTKQVLLCAPQQRTCGTLREYCHCPILVP